MHQRIDQLKEENRALQSKLENANVELNKAVQDDCQVFLKIREFSPDEIAKWDPDVKAALRAQMQAAINRVKTLFGDATEEGGTGRTLVSQFIISAQEVMALLDCEQLGPTVSTPKSAGDVLSMTKALHRNPLAEGFFPADVLVPAAIPTATARRPRSESGKASA